MYYSAVNNLFFLYSKKRSTLAFKYYSVCAISVVPHVVFSNFTVKITWTYPYLVRWRSRVRFPGSLGPGRGRSPAHRARAQSHVVGVLPPFPRIDHEVAEAGACRRQSLRFLGFDRGGLDNGHQNSFGRVVAENNVRVLVIGHCMGVKTSQKQAKGCKRSNSNWLFQQSIRKSHK